MLARATCEEFNLEYTCNRLAVVKLVAEAAAASHTTCRNQPRGFRSFTARALWLGRVLSSLPAGSVSVIRPPRDYRAFFQ